MANKVATLTVQKWGNSLAIRIPAGIARGAHFEVGTPIEIALQEVGIAVKPIGERRLTLDERLALYDAKKYGTEVMESGLVGKEKFE